MDHSLEKRFQAALAAAKPKQVPRPSVHLTGEIQKIRQGAGKRVHIADVITSTDKSGHPTQGIWIRCSKSRPSLWRQNMQRPSTLAKLPDDTPVTCEKCDPASRNQSQPLNELPLDQWRDSPKNHRPQRQRKVLHAHIPTRQTRQDPSAIGSRPRS